MQIYIYLFLELLDHSKKQNEMRQMEMTHLALASSVTEVRVAAGHAQHPRFVAIAGADKRERRIFAAEILLPVLRSSQNTIGQHQVEKKQTKLTNNASAYYLVIDLVLRDVLVRTHLECVLGAVDAQALLAQLGEDALRSELLL